MAISPGDVFVCTTMEALLPTVTYLPAGYDTAEKKMLSYPSEREDVADFITEYLYSDVSWSVLRIMRVFSYQCAEHWDNCVDLACLGRSERHGNSRPRLYQTCAVA